MSISFTSPFLLGLLPAVSQLGRSQLSTIVSLRIGEFRLHFSRLVDRPCEAPVGPMGVSLLRDRNKPSSGQRGAIPLLGNHHLNIRLGWNS